MREDISFESLERGEGRVERGDLWSTRESEKGRVFCDGVAQKSKEEDEAKRRALSPLPFYFPSIFCTFVRSCSVFPRVLSLKPAAAAAAQTKKKRKQKANPMRLSLAALAQIGRLPTPPAAALEAVSSETKVRDFFREVRAIR